MDSTVFHHMGCPRETKISCNLPEFIEATGLGYHKFSTRLIHQPYVISLNPSVSAVSKRWSYSNKALL